MWLWEQLQEAAFASRSTTLDGAVVEIPAASIIVERVFNLHSRKLLLLEIEREAEREIENLAR